MFRTIALITFLSASAGCQGSSAPTAPDLSRSFDKAGFSVDFPCEPREREGVFQKEPKLARSFSYECLADGITYSVSLAERFEEFDPSKAAEQLYGVEQLLKESVGPEVELRPKEIQFEDYRARELLVIGKSRFGRMLNIAHPRGMYGAQAYSSDATNHQTFELKTKKFFASFKLRPTK